MAEPLLKVEGVTSGYGAILAVRDVSIEVNTGEVVALLGANGAGKSTLLMTIAGLVNSTAGHITFAGKKIDHMPPERILRAGIALTPEGRRVFAHLSVADNLRMGAASRRDAGGIAADTEEVLELFPRLSERYRQLAGTLSGGEQQMLALGRSLMSRPKLMLLDEPSLGLAPRIVAQIFDMVQALPQRGVTVLVVEQNVRLALTVASRGYVMATGEVQASGSSAELRKAVDLEKVYLGTDSRR
ncbi:MAG TPA: ABC transporter ATP-binding protein [Thermoleophilia bacterium]|nr:ABC transporter ATP-binding protein [Thermoleophilia bacterium]